MNNDLISRNALFKTWDALDETQDPNLLVDAMVKATQDAPTVDAEPMRHEGNTTFVTTDNLDAYADRIIVVQGNWCKVYYRDSDDAEVQDGDLSQV